ncbi:MAG: cation:proton antiporter [Halobacteriovoraceae bacterium]|nr:cation:proton antiporter [Halobacteriovoraceae bacterium]
MTNLSKDLEYILIFLTVLLLPKILLRFKIPSGVTALFLGLLFSFFDPTLKGNQLLTFLSQIGITSLFLFAGFEIDFKELKEERSYLTKYLLKFTVSIALLGFFLWGILDINFQSPFLLILGLMTPSAGFIISSLGAKGLPQNQEYWIKSKAISKEILSILFFFLILQSGESSNLYYTLIFIAFMVVILPKIFSLFFRFISPYAPNSEIPFLISFALASGVVAKEVGLYYLIGAFIVGITASRLKSEMTFHKKDEEQIFFSLSQFFVLFMPFYFFYTGLSLDITLFSISALFNGILFLLVFIPIRLFLIRSEIKNKNSKESFINNISISLLPTLIFGLVISKILLLRADISPDMIGGLIIYTILSSLLPAVFGIFKSEEEKKDEDNELDKLPSHHLL